MDLKERMETVKGLQLEYDVQGYLSTNDADFLIGTLELMQDKIERYEIALKEIASREGDFYEDEVASIAKEALNFTNSK